MIDNSWYIDKLLIVNNYQTLPFFCFSIKAFFLCFFVICWQDGEISYYNAKDNVSTVQLVLLRFFYYSFPFPFLLLTSIFYPQFLPFVEAFSVPPLPLTQAFFPVQLFLCHPFSYSLRWRGLCHVSCLIDRWDVWAGYAAALLGSKCSLFFLTTPLCVLSFIFFLSQHLTDSLLCVLA